MKVQLTITILFFYSISLLSQTGFETKTVAIFKNNSAFFVKNGNIVPKDKHHIIKLEEMPRAAYGTLWLTGEHFKHLTIYQKNIEKPQKPVTINHAPKNNKELLTANIGKSATLHVSNDIVFNGIIKATSENLVFLEQPNGEWLNFPINRVQWVTIKGKTNGIKTTTKRDTLKTVQQIADLSFYNNNPQKLELIYFQNGLNWIPSYKVELLDDDKAKIMMKAAVSNNAEDLKNVNINFVVGYPNIKYANQLDVLWNNQNFAQIYNPNIQNSYVTLTDRAMRGSANMYYEANFDNLSSVNVPASTSQQTTNPSLTGKAEEDLYFYTLENITIPKGGKGYFSIFEAEVPVTDLYEVVLTANHNNYYSYQPMNNPDIYRNKVWHILKLENKSPNAWTTGAAMVVKKDGDVIRPISQDDLNYTPKEGKANLKLTISPDVSVKDSEQELGRQPRKQMSDGYYYEIVKVKGEVKIHNFKTQDIKLNVKKTIVGNLSTSAPEWQTIPKVNIYTPYNQTNEVCWEMELKAGEKKTVEYEYEVYVRR